MGDAQKVSLLIGTRKGGFIATLDRRARELDAGRAVSQRLRRSITSRTSAAAA